jgi:hypothetical protein
MGWGVISKESPTEISHAQFVHLCYTGDFSPAKAGFEMTTLFIRFLTANGAGKLFRNDNFIHGISPPFGRRNDKGNKGKRIWSMELFCTNRASTD